MYVAKTKALISFAVTAKLICVSVFAYAKLWFSHDSFVVTKQVLPYRNVSKIADDMANDIDHDQTTLVKILSVCLILCFTQLKLCREGQSLSHTVPGQAFKRQLTSIK